MSVTFGDNSHQLECDLCSRKPEYYFGDWQEAWKTAKADGWRAWKDGDDWCHACPDCVTHRTDGSSRQGRQWGDDG